MSNNVKAGDWLAIFLGAALVLFAILAVIVLHALFWGAMFGVIAWMIPAIEAWSVATLGASFWVIGSALGVVKASFQTLARKG